MANTFKSIKSAYKTKRKNCIAVSQLEANIYYLQEEDAFIAKGLLRIDSAVIDKMVPGKRLATLEVNRNQVDALHKICHHRKIDLFVVNRFERLDLDYSKIFKKRNRYDAYVQRYFANRKEKPQWFYDFRSKKYYRKN